MDAIETMEDQGSQEDDGDRGESIVLVTSPASFLMASVLTYRLSG